MSAEFLASTIHRIRKRDSTFLTRKKMVVSKNRRTVSQPWLKFTAMSIVHTGVQLIYRVLATGSIFHASL
jgi:chloramphenicol O-acetyltransferase